jgi:hypothetical protein
VVGSEEGRPLDQVVARLEGAGERVDRGQLQRLLDGQVRQDAGQPLGQGRLPGAFEKRSNE